jgi:hypothetical protein
MKCKVCGEWCRDPILMRPVPCLCDSEEEEKDEDETD